jgi:hypothetical protein
MLGSQQRRIPWGREDISSFLDATRSPNDLHQSDRRGLTPVAYAALVAAQVSISLLPLLALLDPPEAGEDRIAQMLILLESIDLRLKKLETKIDQIVGDSRASGSQSALPPSETSRFSSHY